MHNIGVDWIGKHAKLNARMQSMSILGKTLNPIRAIITISIVQRMKIVQLPVSSQLIVLVDPPIRGTTVWDAIVIAFHISKQREKQNIPSVTHIAIFLTILTLFWGPNYIHFHAKSITVEVIDFCTLRFARYTLPIWKPISESLNLVLKDAQSYR